MFTINAQVGKTFRPIMHTDSLKVCLRVCKNNPVLTWCLTSPTVQDTMCTSVDVLILN